MKTIEAIVMCLVFAVFLACLSRIPSSGSLNSFNVQLHAYHVLEFLDIHGYLSKIIYLRNIEAINMTFSKLLLNKPYSLTVIDPEGRVYLQLSVGHIQNGYSATYFLSGYNGSVAPLLVILCIDD